MSIAKYEKESWQEAMEKYDSWKMPLSERRFTVYERGDIVRAKTGPDTSG